MSGWFRYFTFQVVLYRQKEKVVHPKSMKVGLRGNRQKQNGFVKWFLFWRKQTKASDLKMVCGTALATWRAKLKMNESHTTEAVFWLQILYFHVGFR